MRTSNVELDDFGRNATEQFLRLNEMDMLVRSHECRQQGFSVHHDGRCVTIFSAPNYCDSVGNLGAVLRICARAPMEDEDRDFRGEYTAIRRSKASIQQDSRDCRE